MPLTVVVRQLAPRPFSDLSHVPVLLDRAVHVIGILRFVVTPEAIYREATADKGTSAEDNEEDDERWGDLKAHVVSFVEVHGCGGVTV